MVTEEELLRQAEEAERELSKADTQAKRSNLWLGLMLGLLIVVMIIPYQHFSSDKNPHNIPSLSEIQQLIPASEYNKTMKQSDNSFLKYLDPSDPVVKKIANKIVVESCKETNKACYAKALFYFVRDEIIYVSDPPDEYLEPAVETLLTGGADCDGHAILLANLLEAVGFHTRFVLVPQHSYVQVLSPDLPSKYKDSGNWVNLDATCKSCDFSELPRGTAEKTKTYVG